MQAKPDHTARNHGTADDAERLGGRQAISGSIEYCMVQDVVDVATELDAISLSVEIEDLLHRHIPTPVGRRAQRIPTGIPIGPGTVGHKRAGVEPASQGVSDIGCSAAL